MNESTEPSEQTNSTDEEVKRLMSSLRDVRIAWAEFFRDEIRRSNAVPYSKDLEDIARLWPEKRSIVIDWVDIERYNPALAEVVLQKPRRVLEVGQKMIQEVIAKNNDGKNIDVRLRIGGLLGTETVSVRHLRQDHVGRLVCISGLIRQASEIRPRLVMAKYACAGADGCGHIQTVDLTDETTRIEPTDCPQPDGCGRPHRKFTLLEDESRFVDTQDVYLQEAPEGMSGGAQPERILCKLEHDLCDDEVRVNPGDRVRMTGIIMPSPLKKKNALYNELYLDVVSVERAENGFDNVAITEDDIRDFKKAVRDPKFIDKLAESIAPSIKGYEIEKKAMALQIIGGGVCELEDGTHTRGDIHILLAGDPGVAKTQLLRAQCSMVPRAVYAQGGSTSKVGLTAATVRDELTSRWTLEAGALVLADGGIACLDELDKMGDEDAAGMHEAMESQTITIAKAGIRAEMKCRAPILAAANPIHGRWDENAPFAEQLGLSPALLSRFDLIFAPRDRADRTKDVAIAEHILRRRTGKIPKTPFTLDFARKFFSYARRNNTVLDYTPEAAKMLTDFYADLRGQGAEGSVAVTPRQNEGIARLAEAAARARLRQIVTKEDVEVAIPIVQAYLNQLRNEDGAIDIYKQVSDTTSSERGIIENVVHQLRKAGKEGVYLDDLIKTMPTVKLERLEGILKKMSERGEFIKVGEKMIAV